jgi:hypothetical protein
MLFSTTATVHSVARNIEGYNKTLITPTMVENHPVCNNA